jgi:hypothetical protein
VETDGDTGSETRMPNQGRNGTLGKAQAPAGRNALPVSLDHRNFAQQIVIRHRRIELRHGVATSQDRSLRLAFAHKSMRREATVTGAEHNVSLRNRVVSRTLNRKRITGPDRRQHAPSGDAEPKPSRRAQHFARQFAPKRVSRIEISRRRIHESFLNEIVFARSVFTKSSCARRSSAARDRFCRKPARWSQILFLSGMSAFRMVSCPPECAGDRRTNRSWS